MKPTSVVSRLLAGGLGALVLVLAWRSRGWALVHDAPIMHYIGWRILEGAAPYRELFDMNFPGVYLLHAGIVRVLGVGDLAWRAFDLTWLAGTAAAAYALASAWGRGAAWGAALLFAAYHLAGGAWQAGQRDFLLCPFLLLGALGVVRWLEARSAGALVWGGVALGMGLTIKPQSLLFVGFLGVLIVVSTWRDGAVLPITVFGVAVAAPMAAMVAWLASLGSVGAWRDIVLGYLLPLYSGLGRPQRWGFYRDDVWVPIAAALVMSMVAMLRRRGTGPRHVVAMLGLLYGAAHYFGQGKGWEYHAYPAAAFAVVLLFSEIDVALAAGRRLMAASLVAGIAVTALLLADKGVAAGEAVWIDEKLHRVDAVVAALGGRLAATDRVQVLDTTDGGIHALLRLRAVQPTRFLYDFQFFHDETHPTIRALRAEFLRDLVARPPRFIVLFRWGWPSGGFERVEERFTDLNELLGRAYTRDRLGDGFIVYAKRDDS